MKLHSLKMLQQAFSLSFPILLSFIFSLFSVSTADSNVYVQCSQLKFTSLTPYESNVNSLFSSLIDSASVYNFNKFETSPQSDAVYGLFQCRGDVSSKNCNDCVTSSINQLKATCPMSTGGEIQLEACFVKYADTTFFGVEDKMEVCKRCGPSIGYNSDVLNRIDGALAYLVRGNGEYFRGGDFGSVQGVAQCVQDLSLSDCQDCLAEASGRLRSECETSSSGDMYLGKCYIRYSVDQGDLSPDNNDNDNDYSDNDNNDNNDNSNPDKKKRKKRGKGRKNTVTSFDLSDILTFLLTLFGNISLTHVFKDTCNKTVYRYNYNEMKVLKAKASKAEKEVERFKKEAEILREAEKVGKGCITRLPPIYQPPIIPPPPCHYQQSGDPRCYIL